MIARLPGTDHTIVAGRTVSSVYADVIESCVRKIGGIVAGNTILCGGQMAIELTDGDHVVVAESAIVDDSKVIVGARSESAGCVADAAVFSGRHMVARLAARCDTVAGSTVVDDAGMVEDIVGKVLRVVADATVVIGRRVGWRFTRRTDAVAIVVARFARLHRSIQTMIKHAIQTESRRAVAGCAIDVRQRMSERLPHCIHAMTAIATTAQHVRTAVVRESALKTRGGMTLPTLRICLRMWRRRRLTQSQQAVVTS